MGSKEWLEKENPFYPILCDPMRHWRDDMPPINLTSLGPMKDVDLVNNPPHYTKGGIECIDAIQAALTPEEFRGYLKGNALKYTWRELHKGGDESLEKAQWYLNRATKK